MMLCSDSCPKCQFYEIALFMQLSHNRVVLQCLNSPGGAGRGQQRAMSEVRNHPETSQPRAFPSGPQCSQVDMATVDVGTVAECTTTSQGASPATLLM